MKPILAPFAALPLIALLAACGADGDPVRPSASTTVGINSNGTVTTSTNVSASTGNVTLSVGL